jgi:hypothetical protein
VRALDASAEYFGPCAASALRACHSWLNRFCNDCFLRGYKRTCSHFHRGVITGYALEVGAAEQGENRDPSFPALGAIRYPIIHDDPSPIFHPQLETVIFHSSVLGAGPMGEMSRSVADQANCAYF